MYSKSVVSLPNQHRAQHRWWLYAAWQEPLIGWALAVWLAERDSFSLFFICVEMFSRCLKGER